jgi:hypothetical protein
VLQDADDEVALEAAEFWLSFCESELGMELLIPVLSRLIPVLMKNMVSGEVECFAHRFTCRNSEHNTCPLAACV